MPYNHWSLPVGDRHPQQVTTPTAPEGSGNSAHNTTLDKKHRSHDQRRESRKILATQQQRVAEWVKGQSDGAAAVSVETGTNSHMTQSLPRPMRRTPTPESGSHWQCPTRTFSYIQAQVYNLYDVYCDGDYGKILPLTYEPIGYVAIKQGGQKLTCILRLPSCHSQTWGWRVPAHAPVHSVIGGTANF